MATSNDLVLVSTWRVILSLSGLNLSPITSLSLSLFLSVSIQYTGG